MAYTKIGKKNKKASKKAPKKAPKRVRINEGDTSLEAYDFDFLPGDIIRQRSIQPYDIEVTWRNADMNKNISASFNITLTNFFRRHPNLRFKQMAVGTIIKLDKRKKKVPSVVVAFDNINTTHQNAEIRNPGKTAFIVQSKAHVSKFLRAFNIEVDPTPGKATKAFFKLIPQGPDDTRQGRRICEVTLFRSTEREVAKK